MKFWKILLSVVLAVSLFGCAARYQEPQPITTYLTGLSKEEIKKSILSAASQGPRAFGTWTMRSVNNNTVQATLFNRGFEVKVNIIYSEKGYVIKYVSASQNLQGPNGKIHRNYNRWVKGLDTTIKQNSFMLQ